MPYRTRTSRKASTNRLLRITITRLAGPVTARATMSKTMWGTTCEGHSDAEEDVPGEQVAGQLLCPHRGVLYQVAHDDLYGDINHHRRQDEGDGDEEDAIEQSERTKSGQRGKPPLLRAGLGSPWPGS